MMRLTMAIICDYDATEFDSTDIGEGAQALYDRAWNAHDAACPDRCGTASLIVHGYARRPDYEERRLTKAEVQS